jgi:hypothetical protein
MGAERPYALARHTPRLRYRSTVRERRWSAMEEMVTHDPRSELKGPYTQPGLRYVVAAAGYKLGYLVEMSHGLGFEVVVCHPADGIRFRLRFVPTGPGAATYAQSRCQPVFTPVRACS